MAEYDVVVIGSGVSGLTAAIAARMQNLKAAIVCSRPKSSRMPGELLDGAAEHLLRELQLWSFVCSNCASKVKGHWIKTTNLFFVPHANKSKTDTLVIPRPDLEMLLAARAQVLRTDFHYGEVSDITIRNCGLSTIRIGNEDLASRFLIDATGSHHLLAKRLALLLETHSPRMLVLYGYRPKEEFDLDQPILEPEESGWTWTAPASTTEMSIMKLIWHNDKHRILEAVARDQRWKNIEVRASDVTWRIVSKAAGSAYFAIGDAACIIDPGSGDGITRALSSGITAARLSALVLQKRISAELAASLYVDLIWKIFRARTSVLRSLYALT